MSKNLEQLKLKREICKAEIKEKQKELHRLTNAICVAEWRMRKKESVK